MSFTSSPSDLSEAPGPRLEPLLPPPQPGGRVRRRFWKCSRRFSTLPPQVVPGARYPMIFQTIARYLVTSILGREQVFGNQLTHHDAIRLREPGGRHKEPSRRIIVSLSVKTVDTAKVETRGFDVHKWLKGRKRHILVDTLGGLLAEVITAAKVTDRDGALASFAKIPDNLPLRQVIRADPAYSGVEYTSNVQPTYHRPLEIIKREKGSPTFPVLPTRWLVERTFGGLNHFRQLSKA